MNFFNKLSKLFVLVGFIIFLLGCKTLTYYGSKKNNYVDGWVPLKATTSIAVFPFLRDASFDAKYIDRVEAVLMTELSSAGHEVTNHKDKVREGGTRLWTHLFDHDNFGLTYDFDYYSYKVKHAGPADVYVFPVVVAREAKLKGKMAHWDGVQQNLEEVGGNGIGKWSGKKRVYSLKLEVFDSVGKWMFTSYGGISVPVYAHMRTRELRKKDDLFESSSDQKRLKKGVKVSVRPLFIYPE